MCNCNSIKAPLITRRGNARSRDASPPPGATATWWRCPAFAARSAERHGAFSDAKPRNLQRCACEDANVQVPTNFKHLESITITQCAPLNVSIMCRGVQQQSIWTEKFSSKMLRPFPEQPAMSNGHESPQSKPLLSASFRFSYFSFLFRFRKWLLVQIVPEVCTSPLKRFSR